MGKAKTTALVLLALLLFLFGCTQLPGNGASPYGTPSNASQNPLDSFSTQAASGVAKDAKYYVNEGLALFQQGDMAGAKSSFELAIGADPNYAPAYFARGQFLAAQADFNNALKDYNSAIAIDPQFLQAHEAKYNLLNLGGFFNQSFAACRMAADLGSHSPQVFNDFGIAKFKAGDVNGSIQEFTRSLSLGADDPQVLLNRAIAFNKLEMRESAADDLREYLKLVPNDNKTKFYLGQIEAKMNRTPIGGIGNISAK